MNVSAPRRSAVITITNTSTKAVVMKAVAVDTRTNTNTVTMSTKTVVIITDITMVSVTSGDKNVAENTTDMSAVDTMNTGTITKEITNIVMNTVTVAVSTMRKRNLNVAAVVVEVNDLDDLTSL